jgi:excisionase family DNA binding protein
MRGDNLNEDKAKHAGGGMLNEKQVAELLGVSLAWVRRRRNEKTGIPFRKLGKLVRYWRADVDAWVNAQAATA